MLKVYNFVELTRKIQTPKSFSTLPKPLLHQSRRPLTLQNEYVALQPHLAPPTPPKHLYVCIMTHPSFTMSVCCATSLSIIPTAPQSVHCPVHTSHSQSVIQTHLSVTPPIKNRKISMIFLLVSCCSCVNNPSSS